MKPRTLGFEPRSMQFAPVGGNGLPISRGEPVYMTYDEFEAFRLVFYEGLTQEEAASKMGVSRGTLWRCLDNARRKVATMLAEGRLLVITSQRPAEVKKR